MTLVSSRRAEEVEIMDAGGYDEAEIRSNLADLRFFNRWFGGSRLIAQGTAKVIRPDAGGGRPPARLTLLDVATASGDIPAYLARWCARRGIDALIEGIDTNADILAEAQRYQAGLNGRGDAARVSLLRADACRLPHADRSIDVTVCSNFLHHLDSAMAVAALREMKRVSRLGVVVVDLRRGLIPYFCIWALTRITTPNRMTRHDGTLSVQRAFTPDEMASMAREAGLTGAELRRDGPVRLVMTWRRD